MVTKKTSWQFVPPLYQEEESRSCHLFSCLYQLSLTSYQTTITLSDLKQLGFTISQHSGESSTGAAQAYARGCHQLTVQLGLQGGWASLSTWPLITGFHMTVPWQCSKKGKMETLKAWAADLTQWYFHLILLASVSQIRSAQMQTLGKEILPLFWRNCKEFVAIFNLPKFWVLTFQPSVSM